MSLSLKADAIGVVITVSWWLLLIAATQVAGNSDTSPLEIKVTPGPDWLNLTWARSSINESQSFNVSYVPTDGSSAAMQTDQILSNATHFRVTLELLITNTEYRITTSWLSASGKVSTVTLTAYTTPGLVIGIEVMVLTQLDKASRPLPKSTVKIIWSPLLAVTRYEVNITELESGLVAYHNFTKAPPLRIEQSLNHYTRYSVTVTAHSTGGHGPASKEKTFLTDEGIPSIPRNITVTDHTHNTITIAWLPPLEPNGILVNYELSYYKMKFNSEDASFDIEESYPSVKVAVSNYTLMGLAPATIYYCQVQAWNNRYSGVHGAIGTNTYYGQLTAEVTNVTVLSTSSVEVVWDLAVSWDTDVWDDSVLSHYNLTVQNTDHSDWSLDIIYYPGNVSSPTNSPHEVPSGLTFIISELPFGSFHLYTVTVKPISNLVFLLFSRSSPPFLFRTAEDFPGPPVLSSPEFIPFGLTPTMLFWTSPANPNGIIRQYQIEISTVSYALDPNDSLLMKQNTATMNVSVAVNTSANLQPTITGALFKQPVQLDQPLANKHSFKVRAVTSVGKGNFSNEEVLTYSGNSFPRLMSVSLNATSTTIRVLWLNPLYNNSAVDNYYLFVVANKEYNVYSTETETVKKSLNDSRWVTIPVNKAQTIPTQYEDVTLYEAFVSDIIGNMDYTVTVLSTENVLDRNPSEYSFKKISIPPMEPPFVFEPDVLDEGFQSGTAKVGKVTTSERMVRVSSVSGINGNVVKYAIIVLQLPTGTENSITLFEAEPVSPISYEYNSASTKPPYFAFLDEWIVLQFSVRGETSESSEQKWEWYEIGKETDCVDVIACNKPLSAGTSYRFKLRAYAVFNESDPNGGVYKDSDYSQPCSTRRNHKVGLIVQLAIGSLLVVVVVIGIAFIIKARNKYKKVQKTRRLSAFFFGFKRPSIMACDNSPPISALDITTWL